MATKPKKPRFWLVQIDDLDDSGILHLILVEAFKESDAYETAYNFMYDFPPEPSTPEGKVKPLSDEEAVGLVADRMIGKRNTELAVVFNSY